MAEISESELNEWAPFGKPTLCEFCNENLADIWLCGEGWLCAKCFADAADISESIVLQDEVTEDHRVRAKASLFKDRDEG